MKAFKLFYIIILLNGMFSNAFATVRMLNNNNPSPGQYSNWNAVQAACVPGDTVYVSGSAMSYGNILVIVNNLTLVGTGHNPQKQNPLVSSFDTIRFEVAQISLNGIKAACVYQQVNPVVIYISGSLSTHVSIDNCLTAVIIDSAYYDTHYTIHNSILYQENSITSIHATFTNTISNPKMFFDMRNNLVFGSIDLAINGFGNSVNATGVFLNNVFQRCANAIGISYNELFRGGNYDSTFFSNNILFDYNIFKSLANTFTNSYCLNNCIGTYGIPSPTFISLPNDSGTSLAGNPGFINGCNSLCGFSYTNNFHLLSTSICKNAGSDGTDIGAYGGLYGSSFNNSGEPFIPQIKAFAIPAKTLSTNSFNATITSTVKSGNGTTPIITHGEYFWNTDPGVGLASSFVISSPADSVTINVTINTFGSHKFENILYARTKDNTGKWSLSEGRSIYMLPPITAAEYFWDTDPGVGNGTALSSFTAADSVNINESISTTGITNGYHQLYTRTKDVDGVWSIAEGRTIYVEPLLLYGEGFWDTDPGLGHGTIRLGSIWTNFNVDSINSSFQISTTGISKGFHNFYTRFKDNNGKWSLTEGRSIYVQGKIKSAEYFWDTDPGIGNGTAFASFSVHDSINITQSVSSAGLKKGYHFLYTRTKDEDGVWSLSEGRSIYVQGVISEAEYFWDNDPGFGNGVSVYPAFISSDSININWTIYSSYMKSGYHTLYTRTKDVDGAWSIAEGRSIYVKPFLMGGEYFWDTDPGVGNGISIFNSSWSKPDSINEPFSISSAGLSRGTHYLYVRFQDSDRKWGLTEVREVKITNGIKEAEYYFDNDPGLGQATAIPVTTPDTTFNYAGAIILPQLSAGAHKLYFRTKDLDNRWSLADEKSFWIYLNTLQASTINKAEYFFDTDPGLGNGTAFANLTTGSTVNYNDNIVVPQLAGGFHTMFTRTRDNRNHWSLAEPKNIFFYTNSNLATSITAASYFIDTDAGVANDIPISITAGATVNFNSVITLPSITNGVHTFNLRTRDNTGKYSIQEPRLFFANTANATQITKAEFFIDTDPGVGSATTITINTPASTVDQCSRLVLPSFATGARKLFLRTKDNRGIWALQEPLSFTGVASPSVTINVGSFLNICAGNTAVLIATTVGGPWTPQWYFNCAPIVGANSLSLTVSVAGTYTIVITNGSISQSATVTVNSIPLPTQFTLTGGGNRCSNQLGGLSLQLSGSQTGVEYQLHLNTNTPIGAPIAGTGNPITFPNQAAAGVYSVIANTVTAFCNMTMTGTATITVTQATTWYQDADGDGYGNISVSQQACTQPSGYVSDSTDCNDNPLTGLNVHPNTTEICANGIDDNCNGQVDEGCVSTINIKLFIEGFYAGNNSMQPVMFNAGVSANDTLCDTVIVELHDQFDPSMLIASDTIVVDIHGNGFANFPSELSGISAYLVIRSRNAIETWSKLPVTISATTIYDFSH